MRNGIRKAAAIALAGAMGCTLLTGCGNKEETKIDPSKTLMTVNDEAVRLGVASFHARYGQAEIYKYYTTYFGLSGDIFDTVTDTETNETYGESLKGQVLDQIKELAVIRQHADDYNVTLTDEEKKAIDDAAQTVIDSNSEEALALLGAEKEDIAELMTLMTYRSKMMDPVVADVDTVVSDEEAQQTSLTYVTVTVPEEAAVSSGAESVETLSGAESVAAAVAVEPMAGAESAETLSGVEGAETLPATESVQTLSGAESVESAAEELPPTAEELEAMNKAQAVIDAIVAAGAISEADISDIAKTVDDSLISTTGQFTTNDPADTTLDSSIVEAVSGLQDGELVEHPVKSSDGSRYYVVRLDQNSDEERTAAKKDSIVVTRKQDAFTETVDGWVDEAVIDVDEDAWKTMTITDKTPLTLADPVVAETAGENAVSGVESIAESAVSPVTVESVAETPAA